MTDKQEKGIVGRARGMSLSLLNATPQLGMWQATGTAIAQAPNLTELREPESGGSNIAFDAHGHSTRIAKPDDDGELTLVKTQTKTLSSSVKEAVVPEEADVEPGRQSHKHHGFHCRQSLKEKYASSHKEPWGPTIKNGLKAFWIFFLTPSGFLITIYGLNIVAWGAMLFFLLLNAAPAMCHPSCNDDYSPRKIWLEICSQILNALFCVTGFGLAPWRFRDFYWMIRIVHFHDQNAMRRLFNQNKAWFRPPAWFTENESGRGDGGEVEKQTFTGERAPPTAMWKLAFTVDMMVLNTLLQAVLCFFMWHYNRFDRPTWATGTFIALGCGVAMFAGIMSWWEGRKVKKIEGPEIKVEPVA
ncbi:hypothetical protein BU25DRAFT_491721 [Macroventuria anomochaeta]|uniref:Uncharacterized protein n=1 Tax=Macroventuria anomochaeta TaxID=301207 RepID=A0ACB6RXM6_9PLEO|nr:uncharacterized protein BU25DRAFT_491721 [Macroventuria anomochaeta]KAF2626780.1 hypothetical protein BU25DRAFT_491721 [Macroventuria anomochaeta]